MVSVYHVSRAAGFLALGCAVLLSFLPTTVEAAVAVDNVTSSTFNTGNSTFSFNHAVGSGATRLLIVGVTDDNNRGVPSVTYNAVAMTAIGSKSNGNLLVSMFRMVNPPSGTFAVKVTWGGGNNVGEVGAISFTGVDQTTPLGTFVTASASTTTPTVNVTSAAGELVVDTVGATGGTLTVDASQAQRWNLTQTVRGGGSTEAGAATVTMSWSLGTSNAWATIAVPVKPAKITIAKPGTNPGNAAIAPGGLVTDLDAFTLQTSSGTDTVTGVTVTLAAGTSAGINLVQITDNSNVVMGTATDPGSDTVSITLSTNITATTSATTYKVRITPKTHANMPAPPGATYAVTGIVTNLVSSNLLAGTDSSTATVTIDNLSPANVTSASATPGTGQVTVSWTNPGGDFSNVVILRNTATITDVPTEGSAPAVDSLVGSSKVRHILSTSPLVDTGLTGGTYYYKIFAKDSSGNYSATGVQVSATVSVLAPTAGEVSSSQTGGTSTTTWAHTTSGTNNVLVVGVSWANIITRTVTSVTYAGQTMTSAGSAVNAGNTGAEIFYLVAPAVGSNTVIVTLSGAANSLVGGAVTLTGVNQTTPLGIFASATGTSVTPSVTVTINTGETVIDTVSLTSSGAITVGVGGQTQQWQAGTSGRGAGSTKPGAPSPTMSWASGNF